MTILIDLDNLTREMVEEALPHLGKCDYAAPCIIGALVPVDARVTLDGTKTDGLSSAVYWLVASKIVSFPNADQRREAQVLQDRFDSGDREAFLAHPRIAALMREKVEA